MLNYRQEDGTIAMVAESEAQPEMERGDDVIIRSVLRGDRDEYRHIVDRYRDQIFSLIMRQVGDREVATELTQDVFVRGYQAIARFRFESRLSTWLTRIALNQTNSYFSSKRYREQCRTEELKPDLHNNLTEDHPDRENHTQQEAELQKLRKAVAALRAKFRDVITLCDLEGRSYQETAEILTVPVGTVRSRLNRARLELKNIFLSLA